MKTLDKLDQIRVASPCPTSWEKMTGDDRVRFCDLCHLNVYNIESLTRKEALSLISKSEGRICARLYRRPDGSVITRDCPVGLRAMRRRVATVAGAVFATLMSVVSVFGQKQSAKNKGCKQQVAITKKTAESPDKIGTVSGTVLDPFGAVIPGAKVTITEHNSKQSTTKESNEDGKFQVSGLTPGIYDIVVELNGFKKLTTTDVALGRNEAIDLEMSLIPDGKTELVGILVANPLIDIEPGKTTIRGDIIHRIPR